MRWKPVSELPTNPDGSVVSGFQDVFLWVTLPKPRRNGDMAMGWSGWWDGARKRFCLDGSSKIVPTHWLAIIPPETAQPTDANPVPQKWYDEEPQKMPRDDMAHFANVLREWWSFSDQQQHTHSWHTREDFIEKELPRLLKPIFDDAELWHDLKRRTTNALSLAEEPSKEEWFGKPLDYEAAARELLATYHQAGGLHMKRVGVVAAKLREIVEGK